MTIFKLYMLDSPLSAQPQESRRDVLPKPPPSILFRLSDFPQVFGREFPGGFLNIQKNKMVNTFPLLCFYCSPHPLNKFSSCFTIVLGTAASMISILHCPGNSLWCPQSHTTAKEGSALSRPSSSRGRVPCSVKKWGPSDFSAHKASEAGFLPKPTLEK